MRALTRLAVLLAGLALSGHAFAQADCMVSLNVKPTKSVTVLNFGPNAGDSIAKTMQCPVAERLRTDMFVSGQALDPNLLGNAIQLRAKIVEIKAKLATHKSELQTASTRAKREAVLKTVKIVLLTAGTATASTGCVTTGTSCLVALGGVVALYEIIESTATTAGDLAQQATQARAEIDKVVPVLQAMETQLNDNLAQQGRLRFNVAFAELCKAIKQQCL